MRSFVGGLELIVGLLKSTDVEVQLVVLFNFYSLLCRYWLVCLQLLLKLHRIKKILQ